jgi:hypothetical protein
MPILIYIGHCKEKSLAIYPHLALADVSPEYQEAIRMFRSLSWVIASYRSFPCVNPMKRFVSQDIPLNSVLGSSVRMEYAISGLGSARSLDQG